jgi:signal transduction histidine kinase
VGVKDLNVRKFDFGHVKWVSTAVWALLLSIFLFDLVTPPEDISVCLAYAIPIFLSLYEERPRPLFYASMATALSLAGWLVQPSSNIGALLVATHLSMAIITQWLVAFLVRLQRHRLADMSDRTESQRRFVNVLSHEVGTALTVVAGQASRLTRLSAQISPNDVKQRAEKIRNAARRIELIIDRIRFASSLGDGSIPIERGAVNLNLLLQQLTEQLREETPDRVIDLIQPKEPQIIDGDDTLIRQMFENVITNSIKYSPNYQTISVTITKRDAHVRVLVVDRGSGMSRYDLERIRSPFYRGDNSIGTSGTGIGLYVVDRIVEAHKGHISIDSAPGAGTTVAIDLRQAAESART